MAKPKKMEEVQVADSSQDEDVGKLARKMISTFNNGEERVAWNLAKDDNPTDVKDFISTGSTLLDYVISNRLNGGVPVGKLTEISGEEASGKSLLCAHIIANTQRKGGLAVYIDTENAANPAFMKQVGVDLEKLVYLQPGTIEKVFEKIEQSIELVRAKDVKKPVTILWDSVAATPPQAEIDGTFDPTAQIGLMARSLSKGMRKLTDTVGKDRITLVFTNQLKTKIGNLYGDPMVTPGGKAIPYHASVRIRLTSSTKLKDDNNDVYAIKTNAKCIKSRLGPPLRGCHFEIRFDRGVDDVGSWRDMLHERGLIEKRGGYMYMKDVPISVQTSEDKDGNPVVEMQIQPEHKFREKHWNEMIEGDPIFKEHVLGLINEQMIVSYDKQPVDYDPTAAEMVTPEEL